MVIDKEIFILFKSSQLKSELLYHNIISNNRLWSILPLFLYILNNAMIIFRNFGKIKLGNQN